jgi:protein-L-isoaspartate(D-aspartate) O-methyltransferase
MIDTYKHKGMRERLVKLLAEKGIADTAVLQAIQKIPRHAFVESAFAEAAYEDRPLPIGSGQTISQPYTVARQTELLDVKAGMKVLEIGTGSAYQAAVLCELGVKLFSIERIRVLHDRARELLEELGYKVRLRCGDGSMGWETYAPFDRILVTAASPAIPETFKKQLAIGGKLIIPVGDRDVQTMSVVRRDGPNEWTIEKKGQFQFVPMVGRHGWETE